MNFVPEILKHKNGEKVTVNTWEERRKELLDILSREEYGYMPKPPEKVNGKVYETINRFAAGHGKIEKIKISFDTPKGEFSFPFNFYVPSDGKKHPLIVMINFRDDIYDMYFPAEEIIDNGFALAVVCYNDITSDNNDFSNGIAGMYERPKDTGWGKISMWAFGASRVLDYLWEREEVDKENCCVCGHSRLGKTALWCGANDERFKFSYSNDSGCSGAAYERIKHEGGETIEDIVRVFPFWFCDNYVKYGKNPDTREFDQHFLISAIAPRYVCVGSASLDEWADQYSEQLCCIASSPAWELHGLKGYVGTDMPVNIGERMFEGYVGYHLRDGIHFFSRNDWIALMEFIKKKMK